MNRSVDLGGVRIAGGALAGRSGRLAERGWGIQQSEGEQPQRGLVVVRERGGLDQLRVDLLDILAVGDGLGIALLMSAALGVGAAGRRATGRPGCG